MNCTGRCGSLISSSQSLELAEEQVGPLVGGEAAGEADRQRVGIEHVAGGFDGVVVFVAAAASAGPRGGGRSRAAGS